MKNSYILLAAGVALIAASPVPRAVPNPQTTTYTYDSQGRVIQVHSTGSANGPSTTTYTYDKAHNRVRETTVKN